MQQDVTRFVLWYIHEDGSRSIADILEIPGSTSEAFHVFRRLYGSYRAEAIDPKNLSMDAGYTMADSSVVYPFSNWQ